MSKTGNRRERQKASLAQRKGSNRRFALSLLAVIGVVAMAIAIGVGRDGGDGPEAAMGNFERSGDASALGIKADAETVALGHVPLNTTVEPSWVLVNESGSEVTFGEAHAEVVEGCCPGPLQLGAQTLSPGGSTELTFPLQMHPGMDGAHDFNIHLPIHQGGREAILELRTTGHFSS